MKNYFFAVDLGATSGRTILGSFSDKGLELEEINRFPNQLIEVRGHYYWDIYALYQSVINLALIHIYSKYMREVNARIWEPLPVKEPPHRIGVALKEASNYILIKT